MSDKERFKKLLGGAFEQEYNDVFLYLKEAALFRKKIVSGNEIGAIFDDFSLMELRHADRIASKMILDRAKPEWVFKPLESSGSLREILGRHIESEANTIKVYDEIIALCEDIDFKIILKGIRQDEKEHLEKIVHILKHLKG